MTASGRRILIAVSGSGVEREARGDLAREVGRLLALRGAVVVCGGMGGTMAAAAQGAREAGGLTVGLLPGYHAGSANPFIDIVLPTGLGHARNALVAAAGEAMIALPGGPGTLSEIGNALKLGKTVAGLLAWAEIPGVRYARTAAEAVDMALAGRNTETGRPT